MKKEKLFWAILFTVCIPALLAVNETAENFV